MRPMRELFKACGRTVALMALLLSLVPVVAAAQQPEGAAQGGPAVTEHRPGGEANLILPDLGLVDVGGYNGRSLLLIGMVVSLGGIFFGLVMMIRLKNWPVPR